MVERESPNVSRSDPICPVCLAPIGLKDKVRGLGDDLMHDTCDYTRVPSPSNPAPPAKPPSSI
jgi:hypothetical protein